MSQEKVHLSLHVSPELNQVLETLATDTHTTKSDVLRKAIALMEAAVSAKQHNLKVGILNEDDDLVREIVGL